MRFEYIPGETPGGALIHTIASVLWVLHLAVLLKIVRHFWPDVPASVQGVLVLVSLLIVVGEIEFVGRRFFKLRCVYFKLGDRMSWVVVGGMTLALLLAGGLALNDVTSQMRHDREKVKDDAFWDDYHEKMRALKNVRIPPAFQRGTTRPTISTH